MKENIKIGFIGFGRMGSVLGNALIACRAAKPAQLVVSDPMVKKNKLPHGVRLMENEQKIVDCAPVVFLGVRPLDVEPLAKKLKIKKSTICISMAAGVRLKVLQRYFGGNVIRIIPSYTQRIGEGPILYCVNKKVSPRTMKLALDLLKHIGECEKIPESLLEVATDLTSCAPAFWAYLLNTFVEEASRRGMKRETALKIAASAMLASARILSNESKLMNVIDCVATPGGITREGISILEREFPKTVKRVFDATEGRYKKLYSALL